MTSKTTSEAEKTGYFKPFFNRLNKMSTSKKRLSERI